MPHFNLAMFRCPNDILYIENSLFWLIPWPNPTNAAHYLSCNMSKTHPIIDVLQICVNLTSFPVWVLLLSLKPEMWSQRGVYEDVGCLFAAPNNLLPEGQDWFKEMLSKWKATAHAVTVQKEGMYIIGLFVVYTNDFILYNYEWSFYWHKRIRK